MEIDWDNVLETRGPHWVKWACFEEGVIVISTPEDVPDSLLSYPGEVIWYHDIVGHISNE